MQQAIRWIRAHADEFGINRASVDVMGFSADAYAVVGSAEFLGNQPVQVDGDLSDDVDAENGMPDYLISIYPVVCFDAMPLHARDFRS